MKNLFSIGLVLFAFSFTISIPTLAQNRSENVALDKKNGFRDAIFGSPFTSYKNMVPIESPDDLQKTYIRTADKLKIGDFELSKISYSFYKGKLNAVSIFTTGSTNSRGVLGILEAQYGKGFQTDKYTEKYMWSGKRVFMVYDENTPSRDAAIHLFDKNAAKQMAAALKAAAAKGTSDL